MHMLLVMLLCGANLVLASEQYFERQRVECGAIANAEWDAYNRRCQCRAGWLGPACALRACGGPSLGRYNAVTRRCECRAGYVGEHCDQCLPRHQVAAGGAVTLTAVCCAAHQAAAAAPQTMRSRASNYTLALVRDETAQALVELGVDAGLMHCVYAADAPPALRLGCACEYPPANTREALRDGAHDADALRAALVGLSARDVDEQWLAFERNRDAHGANAPVWTWAQAAAVGAMLEHRVDAIVQSRERLQEYMAARSEERALSVSDTTSTIFLVLFIISTAFNIAQVVGCAVGFSMYRRQINQLTGNAAGISRTAPAVMGDAARGGGAAARSGSVYMRSSRRDRT